MLWELYQQSRIRKANDAASRASDNAKRVAYSVQALEHKIDSLSLRCQALWEILRERTKLTEDDLVAKIREIDLRDGQADGRMGPSGGPCAKCGRVLNQRHTRCIYCGESKGKDHIFQT